ncbi:MAG: hypothetical protein JW837_09120 [Sedimentisphaerales bacterium]|nr:hypothetical protein [Sedimentisphaerales bacterium]
MPELIYINEPSLLFNYNQPSIDPRDGLTLFGPLDKAKPTGIRWGVIGLPESISRMKAWVKRIQKSVFSGDNLIARPIFPGFEAALNTKLDTIPALEISIPKDKLEKHAFCSDKHQRVFRTVSIFSERIKDSLRTEDVRPDVWCVVIPEYVYQNCRPNSTIASDVKIYPEISLSAKYARSLNQQPSFFEEENKIAEEYEYEVNFHHQLKARLLQSQIPIQIIREIKIAYNDFKNSLGNPVLDLSTMESAIAWNLSTAIFYKAGGRPWKLDAAREGVCYIGLVFKQDERSKNPKTACCAAQMFLDSGDGVVFKGAVGPWYRGRRGLYHLNHKSAKEIACMCIDAYKQSSGGKPPIELFIHGRVTFNDEEWKGFVDGADNQTKVVGVQIKPVSFLKLFRKKDHPILRGMAYLFDDKQGLLWSRGMTPRLRTYPGREVPNPILVNICRGMAELKIVMEDVLALTKLNYNACNFADGLPVTLKFADAVGEILTSAPTKKVDVPPLPFKYYI